MDESEKRRERLKAMRLEASQEATNNDASAHSAVHLSNPLIESTVNPGIQAQLSAQSFNFYTDPMAGFYGNKQTSSKLGYQISQDFSSTSTRPWSNETFPTPSLQPPINHFPNPRMQQPHGQYTNASHYTPDVPQGGNFPNPNHSFNGRGWNTDSSRPGGYRGTGNFGYPGSQPNFTSGPVHGPGEGGYPSPGPGSSPSPRYRPYPGSEQGYPSHRPNFRNSTNYVSNQGGYPGSGSNQGRGQWSGESMSSGPSYGRGRGGGRGQGGGGGHNHVSAEERPHMFYNRSMVEDPWKFLEPIPYSVGPKRPRVSESPRQQQQQPSSQPSLAEILAASFNEAANEEPSAG